MLYNIEKKKVPDLTDCGNCPYFDIVEKKCEGLGKACFEYDETTKTIIDNVTKLPKKV